MIVFIAVGLALALGITIPLHLEGIPVFMLTMMRLFGLGFMVGGATLLLKQVTQLANFVENFLLYLSGALLPVHNLLDWLEAFAKMLPTTHGIIVLRKVVLEGQSLVSVWNDGPLGWLIVNTFAYLVIGILVFKWFERRAMNQGVLGQY